MRVTTDRYGQTRITHLTDADQPASLRSRVERAVQARIGASSPLYVDEALEVITAHGLNVTQAAAWATRQR